MKTIEQIEGQKRQIRGFIDLQSSTPEQKRLAYVAEWVLMWVDGTLADSVKDRPVLTEVFANADILENHERLIEVKEDREC